MSTSESYALMAAPVDTTAAASLDTLEVASDTGSPVDYGGPISPLDMPDTDSCLRSVSAVSPTASSVGCLFYTAHAADDAHSAGG